MLQIRQLLLHALPLLLLLVANRATVAVRAGDSTEVLLHRPQPSTGVDEHMTASDKVSGDNIGGETQPSTREAVDTNQIEQASIRPH